MERSKKRSLAQTPAPAKDKIYGSKVNKKGSASSESNAESIKLSDAIVSVLEGKMEEHNAEYPNRKVTLAVLKAVFRRGAGAYSRSHRPTISGGKPNSRTAWAYARVNKFLEKKAGKQVKKAYVQDDDLIGKYAKGGLIAPNGKKSNLTPEQYKLVRTKAFKDWFGDWENDPENASKVVDENGEPMVVYHGTFREFNVFEWSKDGGYYFTEFSRIAEIYATSVQEGKTTNKPNETPIVLKCFLNLRKPLRERIYGIVGRNKGLINTAVKKGYDSLIISGGRDIGGYYDQFVAFGTYQIKLADGTNTKFDKLNPDIRFADGGEIQNMIDNGTIELKMYDTKPEHAEIYGLKSKRPLYFQRVFVDEKQRLNGLGTKILKYLDEYAKSNNHDLIFGHIAEKSEPNVKVIKTMLEKAGYTTIEGNNDFYKYVDSDNYQLPDSTKFMRWWIEWYKPIVDKFNIYISFPLDTSDFPESNVVIMDLFEKKDQEIDAKPYLNEIVEKADEYGTTIYLTPKPRYKYFPKDSEKGRRVTKEYLIEYYKKFGFELTDGDYMKRLPKKKYHLGGDMSKHLAPNGKPSNLTHEQWHLVRTPEFKAWFGDWENDPENASKVVDENGEPLVVYHQSNKKFTQFNYELSYDGAIWFTENMSKIVNNETGASARGIVYEVFLNINKIGGWDEYDEGISYLLNEGFNGAKMDDDYIVFEPEQIKLADGTNTTFDGSNPDIRYADGGSIKGTTARLKPMETIVFDPPLEGVNGAKLVAYTWSYEWTMLPNFEGELVSKRVSDWTQAEKSAETGRDIVHKFTVELPDGTIENVSSESVPILLGLIDRSQVKVFGNLATASKTLAKQQMKLAIMEAQQKEFEEAKQSIIDKGFPAPRVEKTNRSSGYLLFVGDGSCFIEEDGTYDEERLDVAKSNYIKNRLQELGFDVYRSNQSNQIYELKKRLERQKRKVETLLKDNKNNSSIQFAKGGYLNKDELVSKALLFSPSYWLRRVPFLKAFDVYGNYEAMQSLYFKLFEKLYNVNYYIQDKLFTFKLSPRYILEVEDMENGNIAITLLPKFTIRDFDMPNDRLEEEIEHYEIQFINGFRKTEAELSLTFEVNPTKRDMDEIINKINKHFFWFIEFSEEIGFDVTFEKGGLIDPEKAKEILADGKIRGIKLTDKQRRFFWASAVRKMAQGTLLETRIEDSPLRGKSLKDVSDLREIYQLAEKYKVGSGEIRKEFFKGIEVEREHTKDYGLSAQIALNHLNEDKDYYSKLETLKLEKGGKLEAENNNREIIHNSGNAGGVLVGRRHSEGGIKAINRSTGQPLEMEGGEVVITRNAVSDNEKKEFEGEMLTNREILSRINVSGGGVSFEEGGEVDECGCSGHKYNYGGEVLEDYEIVKRMAKGGVSKSVLGNPAFNTTGIQFNWEEFVAEANQYLKDEKARDYSKMDNFILKYERKKVLNPRQSFTEEWLEDYIFSLALYPNYKLNKGIIERFVDREIFNDVLQKQSFRNDLFYALGSPSSAKIKKILKQDIGYHQLEFLNDLKDFTSKDQLRENLRAISTEKGTGNFNFSFVASDAWKLIHFANVDVADDLDSLIEDSNHTVFSLIKDEKGKIESLDQLRRVESKINWRAVIEGEKYISSTAMNALFIYALLDRMVFLNDVFSPITKAPIFRYDIDLGLDESYSTSFNPEYLRDIVYFLTKYSPSSKRNWGIKFRLKDRSTAMCYVNYAQNDFTEISKEVMIKIIENDYFGIAMPIQSLVSTPEQPFLKIPHTQFFIETLPERTPEAKEEAPQPKQETKSISQQDVKDAIEALKIIVQFSDSDKEIEDAQTAIDALELLLD